MTEASGLRAWIFRRQTPLRVSSLMFIVGTSMLLISKTYEVYATGRPLSATPLEVLIDLPLVIVPITALYFVMVWYSDAVRKAQVELRASEELFRSIFDSSAVGIGLADLKGNVLAANAALRSMMGYTEREAVGANFLESFLLSEDRERVQAARGGLLSGQKPYYQVEARFRHKDGRVLWISMTAAVVRDEEGRPHRTVAVFEDVTARRKAEEALSDSEARYRDLVNSSPYAIA
ncbi:MAG TPA: PAS domain S-box protein, partial [Conexivisphaerales archaeon]|nr:PAS domain S-box protein [Conexivisphaerales archaeon]